MIAKIATNPDSYPDCAKEQLCLRFGLVESDLSNRFPETHAQINSSHKDMVPILAASPSILSSNQFEKPISDFEKNKNETQRQFIDKLTTLKEALNVSVPKFL